MGASTTKSQTTAKSKKRAPRDPEKRKRQIVEAAASIIAQGGGQHLTHRRVAEQAGIPLGSTTQYFKNIDDLRHAGLTRLAQDIECRNQDMLARIGREKVGIDALCDFVIAYLSDKQQVEADAMFYAAAINDPQVNGLWKRMLEDHTRDYSFAADENRLRMLSAFLTGLVVESAVNDITCDPETIRSTIRAILASE